MGVQRRAALGHHREEAAIDVLSSALPPAEREAPLFGIFVDGGGYAVILCSVRHVKQLTLTTAARTPTVIYSLVQMSL
jgi:hypothetical protein